MKLLQNILLFFFLLTSIAGVGLSFYLYQTNQDLKIEINQENQKIIQEKEEQVRFQRSQKNEIANLFDDQAALNDDLVDEQKRLLDAADSYISYIDSSIRFVEGRPQFLPAMDEATLLERKNSLVRAIVDLRRISEENSTQKEQFVDRIRQLYLEAEEDRDNTTNDREGIRGS